MESELSLYQEKENLKEAFEKCVKSGEVIYLSEKFKTLSGSETEKKIKVDETAQLYAMDKLNDFNNMKPIFEVLIQAIKNDCVNSSTLFGMYKDMFDVNTLDECEKMFGVFECNIETFKQPEFYERGKIYILHTVNDLLRRTSNSCNLKFKYRMQSFLSRISPISEKSGLNMNGIFNVNNTSKLNKSNEFIPIKDSFSNIESDEELISDSDDYITSIGENTIAKLEEECNEIRNFIDSPIHSDKEFSSSDYMNGIDYEKNFSEMDESADALQDNIHTESIVVKGIDSKIIVRKWTKEYEKYPIMKWKDGMNLELLQQNLKTMSIHNNNSMDTAVEQEDKKKIVCEELDFKDGVKEQGKGIESISADKIKSAAMISYEEAMDNKPKNILDRISLDKLSNNPNRNIKFSSLYGVNESREDMHKEYNVQSNSLHEHNTENEGLVQNLSDEEFQSGDLTKEDNITNELAGISLKTANNQSELSNEDKSHYRSRKKNKMIRVVKRPDGEYFQVCAIEKDILKDTTSGNIEVMEDGITPDGFLENIYDFVLFPLKKCSEDALIVDSMTSRKTSENIIAYDSFNKFWNIQNYLRNPIRITNNRIWPGFKDNICEVIALFEMYASRYPQEKKAYQKQLFIDFIIHEKIFDLQLKDVNFRMTIYTQILIIFQYLLADVKFKSLENLPTKEQKTWILSKTNLIKNNILKSSSTTFFEFLEVVLSQEAIWNNWKNDGCQSYLMESNENITSKISMNYSEIGSDTIFDIPPIYQPSTIDNFSLCENRKFMPELKPFFDTTLEQCKPDCGVEHKLKNLNNEVFLWKSLRLLAVKHIGLFDAPVIDEEKRIIPLATIAERLIVESYSKGDDDTDSSVNNSVECDKDTCGGKDEKYVVMEESNEMTIETITGDSPLANKPKVIGNNTINMSPKKGDDTSVKNSVDGGKDSYGEKDVVMEVSNEKTIETITGDTPLANKPKINMSPKKGDDTSVKNPVDGGKDSYGEKDGFMEESNEETNKSSPKKTDDITVKSLVNNIVDNVKDTSENGNKKDGNIEAVDSIVVTKEILNKSAIPNEYFQLPNRHTIIANNKNNSPHKEYDDIYVKKLACDDKNISVCGEKDRKAEFDNDSNITKESLNKSVICIEDSPLPNRRLVFANGKKDDDIFVKKLSASGEEVKIVDGKVEVGETRDKLNTSVILIEDSPLANKRMVVDNNKLIKTKPKQWRIKGGCVYLVRGAKLTDNTDHNDYVLTKHQLSKLCNLIYTDKTIKWMNIAKEINSVNISKDNFKNTRLGLNQYMYSLLKKSPEDVTVKKLKSVFGNINKISILEKSLLNDI